MKDGLLGILAGKGEMPWIAARSALARGIDLRIYPIFEKDIPADLRAVCKPVTLTKFYTSVLKTLKADGVGRLLLLGKVSRDILYDKPRFDARTILLLSRMKAQRDSDFFVTLTREFENRGIHILPQTEFLSDFFLRPGRYGRSLSAKEVEDVAFGMHFAREINRLDIGQTIVVGNKAVLAVEAAEGTDQCIERGGRLFHNKGAVVCKVAKRNHDPRWDLPVTGLQTLGSMQKGGCRVLAVDAKQTFVMSPAVLVAEAKRLGISLIALNPDESTIKMVQNLNKRESKI